MIPKCSNLVVGTESDLGISYKRYDMGIERSKVKVTGSQNAKKNITKEIEWTGRRELCTLTNVLPLVYLV